MPWTSADASKKNSKIKTAKQKRQWAEIANSVLSRTGNDAQAIRQANGAIGRKLKRK